MDVIALAQYGFTDTVAPLGTALTEQQLTLLWRMVGDPILCFDGDLAGQKAAMRAAARALPLLNPGHSIQFVTLPDGQDPDDILKIQNANGFQRFIDRAMPMVDWVWEKELNARPLDTPEQRAALREHLDSLARSIAHDLVRADYMRTWKDKTYKYFADAAREHYLSGKSKGYYSRRIPVSAEARQISETGLSPHYTRALIYSLIVRPWKIATYFEQLVVIASRAAKESSMLSLLLREELWDRLSREAGSSEPLDVDELDSILAASPELEAIRKLKRSNVLPFSFTRKVIDEDTSANGKNTPADLQFDQFVKVLVEIPEIDKLVESLSSHARRLGDDSNELQASIQKLLRDKRDYLERLSALDDQPAT